MIQILKFIFIPGSIITVFFLLMTLIHPDIPPPDDSHLKIQLPEVKEEENAYRIFENIANGLSEKEISELNAFQKINLKDVNKEQVQTIREKHKTQLELLNSTRELPYSVAENTPKTKYDNIEQIMNITRIQLAEAIIFSKENRLKEAATKIFEIMQIGKILEDSHGSLLIFTMGFSIKNQAHDALNIVVQSNDISAHELKEYVYLINKYKDSDKALENTFKSEYWLSISYQEELVSYTMKENKLTRPKTLARISPFYKYNKTKELLLDSFTILMNDSHKNYNEMEFIEEPKYSESEFMSFASFMKSFFVTGNTIGEIQHELFVPAVKNLFIRKVYRDFKYEGSCIKYLILAFEKEKGRLPNSLDDLVPEYIEEIPADPFDGKNIRYNRGKDIVYSVGKDFRDDGGEAKISVYDDKTMADKLGQKDYVMSIH